MKRFEPKLRIFYDGGCKVCSWEVGKYLAVDHHGALQGIDILDPRFSAESYGLDPIEVRRSFHVLKPDGTVVAGVEAFRLIWEALDTPASRLAARAAKLRPIRFALERGYEVFVRVRPYLPRNAPRCDDGSCELR